MDQSKFNEKNTANEVLAIDLFCGCGGVTEGLKQAGFTVIAAVDNDPICCQTYRLNHPEVSLLEKDICKTSARSLKSILGKRKLDLLVVCAPCQPFSSLNKSKKPDERVYLILQSVRFTKALKPKYVLFENVPGITKNSTVINQLKSEFSKLGYNLSEPKQIDAADYGVPQRRVRCVIVASRKKMVDLPSPTTPTGHRITVRDAIGDLPAAGFINPKDSLHVCRKHSKITIDRLRHISHDGGSRDELPAHLRLQCQQIHNLLALLHETLPNSNVDDAWIESQVDGHFNLRYTRGEPLEAMKAAAKRILKNYLHDDPELRSKVLHAEKPFEFIIGDAMISGTIDLLNKADPAGENEAKVEIVDFKTGKSGDDLAAAERRSHVQQQLQMYAIATQDALGLEPLKATAHFLYANQPHIKEDVELSEEQMENMKHQIANTVTAIKQGRFPLCASKTRCTSCDFKAICNGSTR